MSDDTKKNLVNNQPRFYSAFLMNVKFSYTMVRIQLCINEE